jgi:signal transduction histidine kinase
VFAIRMGDRRLEASPATRRQLVGDALLAGVCLTLVLVVNLSGQESVPANTGTSVVSVTLTVLAVGSVALRRRLPLSVLVVGLLAVLGLVVTRATVGMATLGPLIALYTAVAISTRRNARLAVGAVAAAFLLTALLRPVDLSAEGAIVTVIAFGSGLVLALGTRARRDRSLADLRVAEQRAEAERERAAHTLSSERLRITRELHDVLGHAMSVMVVQAGVAERLLDSDVQQARAAVAEIARTGRRSMSEIRQILAVLRDGDNAEGALSRSPMPTLDDLPALAAEVDRAGLPVVVEVLGRRGAVPAGIDLAAYRVVQEALTNCLKHSGARRADVTVTYGGAAVEVDVVDDGRLNPGVPPGVAAGHGLVGMRERVAIYDGQLAVGHRPGGGFRVHATFPLAVQEGGLPAGTAPVGVEAGP